MHCTLCPYFIPTKSARIAAKIMDNIADGPAICRTTCSIIMNMVIANVELNATRIKSNAFILDVFACSIFEAAVVIISTDVSVDPILFI